MFLSQATFKRDPRGVPDVFPYSIPAIRHFQSIDFPTAVTFFVGENGSGKSTLLEAVAASFGLNPEGGTKHVRFNTRPLTLLAAMRPLVVRNSQFVVVTPSPMVLGYPEATICLFGDHEPRPVASADAEQYQITRAFLEHPDRMLRELFRDEGDG